MRFFRENGFRQPLHHSEGRGIRRDCDHPMFKEVLELLSRERFDAVIAGQISRGRKLCAGSRGQGEVEARVLLVCSAFRDSQIPATSRGYALEGSAGLLSALSALIPAEAGARLQAAA
jgi:hypothetical protein